MSPESTQHWKALSRLATSRQDDDQQRLQAEPLLIDAAGLQVDLSKQQLEPEVLAGLIGLAEEMGLADAIEAQFSGGKINQSGNRPALHTALRARPEAVPDIARAAADTLAEILDLAEAVRSGDWRGATGAAITDVVHIADCAAHAMGFGGDIGGLARRLDPGSVDRLGLDPTALDLSVCEARDPIEQLASTLDSPS